MKKYILFIIVLFIPIFSISQTKYIVLDPGHQWDNTTGVLSPARTITEVQTNLAVAQKLENMIDFDSNIDWDVRLTREDNFSGTNVTLLARERIANDLEDCYSGQVYFLSIHCNGGGGTGTETFYCNEQFNSNDNLLIKYAQGIQDNMVEFGGWRDRSGNRSNGVEECDEYFSDCYDNSDTSPGPCTNCGGHLCVLDDLTMPNSLNEIGFVDSEDETKLLDNYWRWMFAKAYFEGFKEAFSDLNLVSVNVQNLPCYADNNYLCKINVTVKNITNETFNGDVKAVLRDFPMNVYDDPTSEFCQLGSNQTVYIPAQGQRTLIFSANVPFTVKVGMALCIDSKKYNETDWKTVPTSQHKKVVRIPLNGARVSGIVYDNLYNPLQGAEIWSYQKSSNKSTVLGKTNDLTFDPTKAVTDRSGEYEILIPSDWNEAVVSFVNHFNYDEKLVSPIEDCSFNHYYTTSPVIIDIGSGTSVDCAGYVGSNPGNPIELYRPVDHFQNLTINDHEGIICIGKNDIIKLGVSPKPVNYSKYAAIQCDGGITGTTVFYSKIDCNIPYRRSCDCTFLFFGCDCDWVVSYWIYLTKLDDDLNPIGNTISKLMQHVFYNGDISWLDMAPFLIGDVDVNEAVGEAIEQNGSGLYRMKFGYINEFNDWCDKSTDVYLLPDDLVFDNATLSGTYFGNDILVENTIINNNVNLIATNKIRIKPNSKITGNFIASIDAAYCSTKSKSNVVKEKGDKNYKESVLSSSDYDDSEVVLPNRTVSKLSDKCACEKNMVLSDEEVLSAEGISIFPSPASTELNINIYNNVQSQIEIYNLEGKLVEILQTQEDENILDVTNYQEGIYVIKIIKSKKTVVAKFVKTL